MQMTATLSNLDFCIRYLASFVRRYNLLFLGFANCGPAPADVVPPETP